MLELLAQAGGIRDLLSWSFEWQTLTPELIVLLFALLAPIVALWNTDRKGMRQFTMIGLAGALLMVIGSLWLNVDGTRGLNAAIPGTGIRFTLQYIGYDLKGVYAITAYSQLLKAIFLSVAFLTVMGAGRPLKGKAEEDHGEFYSLIMFATLGMMIVASAHELFTMLLGIEIASMSSYILATFKRDARGAEAGLKYFVIGAISSGMLLFGISLIYGATASTNFEVIRNRLAGGNFDVLAGASMVFMLAGLGFKISSVPFHSWAPDVYHGATPQVAGMLASASKAMGFAAIFGVFLVAFGSISHTWELVIALVAVASMTFGNLVALRQQSVTRMLAYSSIAQAGYLLIAVAVGTWYAVGGGLLHLMVNAAMKLGAFLIIGVLVSKGVGDRIEEMRGLRYRAPLLAFAMTIFLLSMAGLPPLGGFASKFVLFSSAIDVGITQHLGWLIWLAVFAVINSAVSLYYYLRVIRAMYVDDPAPDAEPIEVESGIRLAITICLLAVLAIGFYPQPFVDIAMTAARSLITPGA
jgi:proton-translocating NADH-quinone oxidoreductase chain N